ncbi:hypothetical protein V1477_015578 [Vespula maculifrons]|uniref:Uncharacterized protein n=1 Tax=Vespula maculifrons TaxID=7453 RepID=A0ABD2BEI5_VESMC
MLYRYNRLRETTTKSGIGPTFTVTSSVELWTSTETLEIFVDAFHASISEQLIQIYDFIFGFRLKCRVGRVGSGDDNKFGSWTQMQVRDTRFGETTTKYGVGQNFTVTSSVVLLTSTGELRNLRGCHPCKLKCRVGILDFERRRQSRVLDRSLQLLVKLCCGLRRENLEIFADAIHASINEQLIQIYDGIFGCRLKCRVGILDFERRRQSRVLDRPLQLLVQLSFGLRRENLEIFADAIHAIGFERRKQSRVLDRPLQLLVQLSFGLRRENLEIFVDAFHATINEQLIQTYDGIFGFRLKCRVGRVGFGRRRQSRVLDRTFQLLLQLCIGLRRENLEIFGDAFHASSSEQLIQTYDGIFGFRLKCRVGILAFERRRLCRVLDLPLKLLVQLSFGLRQENLEIFVDAFHASINEQLIQTYYGIFGFRLKCRVGILGFERRRQSRVMDQPLQLLVKLCCGLRRENLEIFADAIHASINEQLIQIYDGIFGCRLKCRVGILDFERRRQSRVLDRPLQLLVQLSFGLRRENLEIFADAIHAIGFERRKQSRVLDRPLQLLVQLSFGLRRENLEIFVDAFHATINEQLIQIYDGFFDFRLKCRLGILGLERRQHSTIKMLYRDSRLRETTTKSGLGPTFTVTSSVELWTSTRGLGNFRGCHPCKDTRFGETTTQYGVGPNFTVTSSVVLLTSTGELRNLRGCHP